MKDTISFVIPCYNSSKTIENVTTNIISSISKYYQYEILLINDGSKDNTISILTKLAKTNKKIKVIDFSQNFGQHSAIIAGLRYAKGSIIVCLDDDGQTPPSESIKLIKAIQNGSDIVYAKYKTKNHSAFRNFGSKLNDKMACWLLNKPKELYISSFFACKNFIAKEMIKYNNPYPYIQGLALRSTTNIVNVETEHLSRKEGKSNYSFTKLVKLWLNGFTSFSVKPLRISSFVGFACSFFGFIYGIILIIKKLTNQTQVLGYSSIMSVLLFLGGIILIVLGLIGEYLGRIYISINNSPQYVIKNKINIHE